MVLISAWREYREAWKRTWRDCSDVKFGSPSSKLVWRTKFSNRLTILKRTRFGKLQQYYQVQVQFHR